MSRKQPTFIIANQYELHELIRKETQRALREYQKNAQLTPPPRKEVLTNDEAAEYLGVSKSTLQRMRKSGALPWAKHKGKIFYLRSDILDFIRDHRRPPG